MEKKELGKKQKFILYRVLPVLVVLIVTISVMIGEGNSLIMKGKKMAYDQMEAELSVCARSIERELFGVEHMAVVVADLMSTGTLDDSVAMDSLREKNGITNVAIVDFSGKGVDMNAQDIDMSDVGYPQDASAVSFYYAKQTMYIYAPVKTNDGEGKNLLVCYDLTALDGIFKDLTYANKNWIVMTDSIEDIVYSNHTDSAYYLSEDGYFSSLLDSATGEVKELQTLKGKQNAGFASLHFAKDDRIVFFNKVNMNNMILYCGVESSAMDGKKSIFRDLVVSMVLSVFGSIVLFYLVILANTLIDRRAGKKKSASLRQLAETDQLTGLYNKMTTERKIQEYIEENPDTQSLLFVLDIDNFKKINDTMGHAFGDEVLREIGQGLKHQFRASDILGRAGGDEFIILLKNLKDDECLIREAQKLDRFFKGLQVGTYTKYSVTASIGCAIFSSDGDSFEKLYKQADEALYKAKQRGKNQVAFYKDPQGFGQNV